MPPIRYHGNYCGPGWSAGKYQNSVVDPSVPSIDEFDETCRVHDAAYATNSNLNEADRKFYHDNIGKGYKRSLAALAVKAQSLARSDNSMPRLRQSPTSSAPGSQPAMQPKNKKPRKQRARILATTLAPPTSYASALVPGAPRIKRTSDTSTVDLEFLLLKTPSPSASATEMLSFGYISPYHLGNAVISNLAAIYEEFKVNSFDLFYRGFQGTNNGGSVQIIVEQDCNTILPALNSSTFYSRAFTGANTVVTPIWQPIDMRTITDNQWKPCDPYNCDDLHEVSSGMYYFIQDGTTASAGYIMARANITFRRLRFNPRTLTAGSFEGPATRMTLTTLPTLALSGAITLVGTSFAQGDIYRIILQPNASGFTFPGTTTASTMLKTANGTAFTLTTATTLFAVATSTTSVNLYPTYFNACNQSNQLLAQTSWTSAAGTFTSCLVTKVSDQLQPAN